MIYDLKSYTYNGLMIPMEFFKPITEEMVPGVRPVYMISNIGNLYNTETCKFSNARVRPGDYVRVMLYHRDGSGHMTTIHRLVCMAFNGLPDGFENMMVDHVNGDKTCSFEDNLEWVTQGENNRRYSKSNYKNNSNEYNLSNLDAIDICNMVSKGCSRSEIYEFMKNKLSLVTCTHLKDMVDKVIDGYYWSQSYSEYDFRKPTTRRFSDDEVVLICKALEEGRKYDYIIDNVLNIPNVQNNERDKIKRVIYHIRKRQVYTHISFNFRF